MKMPVIGDVRIGIIGLGYVGLPLAAYMAQHFPVTVFDINATRIRELSKGIDRTNEVSPEEFKAAKDLSFTTEISQLKSCNFYIVTVPTPIDVARRPDFTALLGASEAVGSVLARGDIVVYESTVYPGATEEVCVPVLERIPGLSFNVDFFAGYSPERINALGELLLDRIVLDGDHTTSNLWFGTSLTIVNPYSCKASAASASGS
jgi:UDP-N-acetyl-D-glucosamine/UDP-N-acetyl-D-galactosamine dehydrogenase